MGTSRSSPGAPSGVPMVPSWVPPAVPPAGQPVGPPDPADSQQPLAHASPAPPIPVAPAGRFGPARASLGRFAGSGSRREMQRGLGHYVHRQGNGQGKPGRRASSGLGRAHTPVCVPWCVVAHLQQANRLRPERRLIPPFFADAPQMRS